LSYITCEIIWMFTFKSNTIEWYWVILHVRLFGCLLLKWLHWAKIYIGIPSLGHSQFFTDCYKLFTHKESILLTLNFNAENFPKHVLYTYYKWRFLLHTYSSASPFAQYFTLWIMEDLIIL